MKLKNEGIYEIKWGPFGPYILLVLTAEENKYSQLIPDPSEGLFYFSDAKKIIRDYYKSKVEAWEKLKEEDLANLFQKADIVEENEMVEAVSRALENYQQATE